MQSSYRCAGRNSRTIADFVAAKARDRVILDLIAHETPGTYTSAPAWTPHRKK